MSNHCWLYDFSCSKLMPKARVKPWSRWSDLLLRTHNDIKRKRKSRNDVWENENSYNDYVWHPVSNFWKRAPKSSQSQNCQKTVLSFSFLQSYFLTTWEKWYVKKLKKLKIKNEKTENENSKRTYFWKISVIVQIRTSKLRPTDLNFWNWVGVSKR